jgi:hypothetical protein
MTASGKRHPSTFALDVYWASGRAADPVVEEHLAGCERCRSYMRALEDVESACRARPMPVAPPPTKDPGPRRPFAPPVRRTVIAVVGALCAAGAAGFLLRAKPAADGSYIGTKGTPAVQVLVHRGTTTRVWDGLSPIRPGDALALRVACGEASHVAVLTPGDSDWRLLSEVGCPKRGDPLPFTLVVDGQPGDERLAVVLSRDTLEANGLRKAIAETQRTGDVWVTQFVLPKEIDR